MDNKCTVKSQFKKVWFKKEFQFKKGCCYNLSGKDLMENSSGKDLAGKIYNKRFRGKDLEEKT